MCKEKTDGAHYGYRAQIDSSLADAAAVDAIRAREAVTGLFTAVSESILGSGGLTRLQALTLEIPTPVDSIIRTAQRSYEDVT